jgi:hypothetical protein
MAVPHPLQPFYDGLVDVQQFFYAEAYLNRFTRKVRGFKAETTREDFQKITVAMKSYFATQYLLSESGKKLAEDSSFYQAFTSQSQSQSLSELPRNFQKDDMDPLEVDPGAIRNYLTETKLVQGEKDWIAYSFVPSYFKFYLLESQYEQLFRLLFGEGLKEEVVDAIASVFFLTPAFLHFVEETIAQPFQKLRNDTGHRTPDDSARMFLGDVKKNWTEKQNLCPLLVQRFLDHCEHADEVLRRLFWVPFAKDPARYLACHYSDEVTEMLSGVERSVLDFELGALLASAQDPRPAVTEDEQKVCPQAFCMQIIDEIDLVGLQHVLLINKEKRSTFSVKAPSRYRLFAVHFSGDVLGPSAEEVETATQINPGAAARVQLGMKIRCALKVAPILSPGAVVPPDITTESVLLSHYLEDEFERRDPRPLTDVQDCLARAARDRHFRVPRGDDLTAFFANLKIRHSSGSRVHQQIVQLGRSLEHIRHISAEARAQLPQLLAHRRLTVFRPPAGVRGPLVSNEALIRVELFHQALRGNAIATDSGGLRVSPAVRFHVFAKGIDFVTFRASHQHLAVIDAALSDALRGWRLAPAMRGEGGAPSEVDCLTSDAAKWLASHLRYLDGVTPQLIAAYEENCDPLWKALALQRAVKDVFWTMNVHFGPIDEAGEESKVEILKLAFSYIDPPHVASAFAFVTEFLGPVPDDPDLAPFFALLQRLMKDWFAQRLGGIGLWTLSRHFQRQYSLVFHQYDGTDSASVCRASLFFALITGVDEASIKGLAGVRASDSGWAPVLAVIPDEGGGCGASVLALSEEVKAGGLDDTIQNYAVAVWSSTLVADPLLKPNEIKPIQAFFAAADQKRRPDVPRVRVIMYGPNPDRKKLGALETAITEARPGSALYGVKLIQWRSSDETAAKREIMVVLKEGLANPTSNLGE